MTTPNVENAPKPGVTKPRTIRTGPSAATSSDKKPPSKADFTEAVEQIHMVIALGLSSFAPDTSAQMIEDSSAIAKKWNQLATEDPKVYRFLEKLTTGGKWTGLIFAYSGIGMTAVRESKIMSRVPGLKNLFARLVTPEEPEQEPADDGLGNPLPTVDTPPPFERRRTA